MKLEYTLEKVEGKPTLYHLKVKDSNNLMAETNLFFDLKKEPPAYDSFVISQSDDEYIHNFKGLIIEPSNLSVDINVDVSSKISILKADQGVLGKEGLSVVELPDEPVTLLINKGLDFKASDHVGIFFNQDSKVEIDRLSFERNTEFSLLYVAPVKKLSSLYIKDANFSTIYAKSPIKEMNIQDFNKDSKVVANLYIEADKSNKVISSVKAINTSFGGLKEIDNIAIAKISGQNSLENVVVTCQYESIHLDSNGKIKDSQIEFYTKQDASTYGRTIIGSNFTNAKITNMIDDLSLFVNREVVEYSSLVCDKIQMNSSNVSGSRIKIIANNSSEVETNSKIPIYLENIKLSSKACLEVNVNSDLSKEASIPVEFKNSNFNQYNFFETDNGLSIENSSFKGLRLISSHDDKETISKIDNSIFKDIVRLHNISKVSFSEISNTDISNGKEVEINNEFIKDQRIGEYEEFAKSRQARDSFDKDTTITEDLEVL